MIFRFSGSGWTGRFLAITLAVMVLDGCSPRDQARSKRWKAQVDAYLQNRESPLETDWPVKASEEEEENVTREPMTFPQVVESLPHPQSWPQLQSSMVRRFQSAQKSGDWQTEIQNRLLHLFFIYLNDSERYSTKRWDTAVLRLNARLEAIQANLPEDSKDRLIIDRVRREVANADLDVKKRFVKGDGLDEVRAFEDQLKTFEPMDRSEVASRVSGNDKLERMEKFFDEVIASYNSLMQKYAQKKKPENKKALAEEAAAIQKRYSTEGDQYSKALQDPVVRRYFTERAGGKEDPGYQGSLTAPDLVTIVGESKAEELLKRALFLPVVVDVRTGEATRKLAAKLALQYVDKLKVPQWELANSIEGVPLFEALQQRFPAKKGDSYSDFQRNQAYLYYLFGLIAHDRSDEALALFVKIYPSLKENVEDREIYLPSGALEQMEKAGYGDQTWTFLSKLLDQYPDLSFWNDFIDLSSRLDKNAAMLELVERVSKRPGLKGAVAWNMRSTLADAYLASNRVEEGVAILRLNLASVPMQDRDEERLSAAIRLVELGQLLQRSEWIQEGLSVAEACVAGFKVDRLEYSNMESLVNMYEKLGRRDDAERLIKSGLQKLKAAQEAQKAKKLANPGEDNGGNSELGDDLAANYLEALLALYVNEDKNDEAYDLLTHSPDWGKPDLADFLKDSAGYPSYPTGYWAAWSLGRLGKSDAALAVAKGQIRVRPGSDGAYAVLTKLQGRGAIPFLDAIYRMDQFEERPLIWKAKVLCDAGQLDEAEEAAKAAIAVDPSDGEQGKGDRMRVYAVMSEIAQKRGDEEKAKFYANVIQAIRLSEDADDFEEAGLNTTAIEMYKKALGFFNDAYCIQSRLALQLAKEKREAEALGHYQKAYELMPDSFGRVESHCFGCEGAFRGAKAQGVAERVFLQMQKKEPGKPQIYYLLGYLREEQQRYGEALDYYKQAVALDPLYLNAWKRISGMKSDIRIDPRFLDQVQLKLLALDPSTRHSSPDLSSVNDLPKLWGHMALADRILNTVPVPEAVFELTGSSEALQKKKNADENLSSNPYSERNEKTFAGVLLQHQAVNSLNRALDATRKKRVTMEGVDVEEGLQ